MTIPYGYYSKKIIIRYPGGTQNISRLIRVRNQQEQQSANYFVTIYTYGDSTNLEMCAVGSIYCSRDIAVPVGSLLVSGSFLLNLTQLPITNFTAINPIRVTLATVQCILVPELSVYYL